MCFLALLGSSVTNERDVDVGCRSSVGTGEGLL